MFYRVIQVYFYRGETGGRLRRVEQVDRSQCSFWCLLKTCRRNLKTYRIRISREAITIVIKF